MYKTCMFCNRPLGANQVIEQFPVGRRLAFDAERGRLWVVCRKCERWNLSPLEERWEAVEMCERFFQDTRIRVSTENVGLAKHPGQEGGTHVSVSSPPSGPRFHYYSCCRRRLRDYRGLPAADPDQPPTPGRP